MVPLRSIAVGLFLLAASISLVYGADQASFEVHRLLHHSADGMQFGSQKAAVNMAGVTLQQDSEVSGRMVVLKVAETDLKTLKQVVSEKKPGSLLFIVPDHDISTSTQAEWIAIEQWMTTSSDIKIPVWFALEGEQANSLYSTLSSNSEQTTLVVESADPKELKRTELANVQGLLTGLSSAATSDSEEGDVTKIPTIVLTASWDSVSSVPGLAFGANSDASGVVALLHAARALSKLYMNARTQARYNVVFLLSSGSHLNFAGTRHWIDSSATGSAVRESLEWVVCLDGLAAAGELFLHVSRPAKDPAAARLYDTFSAVAARHGITINISQKKINIAEATASWEHEIFARRKVLAATLSTSSSPESRSSLLSSSKSYDAEALSKNTLFLIEAITRLIYNQDAKAPAIVTSLPNSTLSQGWIDTLTSSPRMVPFVDAKHPLVDQLESTLKQFAPDVSRQLFKPDVDRTFYDAISSTLTSYSTKPFTFDLIMLALALVGNAVLYVIVKQDVSAALADLGSLLVWFKNRFVSSSQPTKTKRS